MAITYVNGDISTSDNVDSVTGLSFTGLGHAAGDWSIGVAALLIDPTPSLDSRFTAIADEVDQNLNAILFERDGATMTGSESGAVSFTTTGTNAINRMSVVFGIWRGVGSRGTIVNFTEGGTADDVHPVANNLSVTPTADNALILLVYSERSSTGNTAGTLAAPTGPGGGSATIRVERGTGGSGGTYVQIAEFQLGAGTANNAQTFTQWDATPDTLIASNAEMWLIPLYPLATGVTGTVAVTQASQTSTAAGQLGYTGTSAVTQAAQVASADGVLGYAGTAAAAQAGNTAAASGQLGYSGSVAVTQAAQVSTAAGQLGYVGSAAALDVADTASATGTVAGSGVDGTVSVTQAAQVAAGTGVLGYTGTSAVAQAGQLAAASGQLGYSGVAAVAQAGQTADGAGGLGYAGTVAVSQGPDVAAIQGVVFIPVTGTVLVVQANQTATGAGTYAPSITIRPDIGITVRPFTGVTPKP